MLIIEKKLKQKLMQKHNNLKSIENKFVESAEHFNIRTLQMAQKDVATNCSI